MTTAAGGDHFGDLGGGADLVVGVGGAEDEAAGVDSEFESGQPVAPDEEGHDDGDGEGEMNADAERGLGGAAVEEESDAVDGGGEQHGHDGEAGGPALDELQGFEFEDVEADVASELGVFLAEGFGVEELEDEFPVAGGDGAEDDREQDGGGDGDDGDQSRQAAVVHGRRGGVDGHAPGNGAGWRRERRRRRRRRRRRARPG